MPVLWRTYFRAFIPTFLFYTFFLTLLSFLFRFKELVFFLDSGAPPSLLRKFILYNTPFFFTLACPLAAAVTGYLISNRLSQFGEWIAYSTLGVQRSHILLAPLIIATHLFIVVFALNADICPKNRLLGKRIVLEAIYQNPHLIFKHFQSPSYPIAVASLPDGAQDPLKSLAIAGQKKGGEHLDLIVIKDLLKTEDKNFEAGQVIQIYHQDEGILLSQLESVKVDRKNIPTIFHFPVGYEEHLPLLGGISLTELSRRICISLLPASLFMLTTLFAMTRRRKYHEWHLLLCLSTAVATYFCYLVIRSTISPSLWWYILIPILPVPLCIWKAKRELR